MSFLSWISGFFLRLFGLNASAAEQVLRGVSKYVTLAEPVVTSIENDVKTAGPGEANNAVAKFVATYERDAQLVQAAVDSFAPITGPTLWRELALFALTKLVPLGTAQSALNLAIELAYSILKTKQPKLVAS